jgi:hypothetical protein
MPFLNDTRSTKNRKEKNSDLNKYARVKHKELKMSGDRIRCRPTVRLPKEIAKCTRNDTTFLRIGAGEIFFVPHKTLFY